MAKGCTYANQDQGAHPAFTMGRGDPASRLGLLPQKQTMERPGRSRHGLAEERTEHAGVWRNAYVATRGDAEAFSALVWTEAVRAGLLRAKRVIVVADGGAWIWNFARDRFSFAEGSLDFYHACQHLWVASRRGGRSAGESGRSESADRG